MTYQKILLFLLIAFIPLIAATQVTSYFDDKSGWTTAAGGVITAQEDFNSFPDSTTFQGVSVAANGFTLIDINTRPTSYTSNYIDGVAPFEINSNGTPNATMFVKSLDGSVGPISVALTFTSPVSSFYAEFNSVFGNERVDIDIYSGASLVATHTLISMNDLGYGFVKLPSQTGITRMIFRSMMVGPSAGGEGFYMDNVCLVEAPIIIPTLSQWALIILGFILLILSVQAIKGRHLPIPIRARVKK